MVIQRGLEGPSCTEASSHRPKWLTRIPAWKKWKTRTSFPGHVSMQPCKSSINSPSQYKSGEDVVDRDRSVDLQSARQKPSFLYRLPVEVRLLIYHHLFSTHVFHLGRVPKSLITTDYNQPFLPRTPFRWIPPYTPLADQRLFPRPPEAPEIQTEAVNHTLLELFRDKQTRWAMLLTCRQIYHEAVGVFYNAAILKFDDPHVLLELATNHLGARGLLAVKHLDVVWRCSYSSNPLPTDTIVVEHAQIVWDTMWRLVADAMQLASLTVCIVFDKVPARLDIDAPWIQSMLQLKRASQFQLKIRHIHSRQRHPCATKAELHRFSMEICTRMIENGNEMLCSNSDGFCL